MWRIERTPSSLKSDVDYFAEQVRAFMDGSSDFPRGEEALKGLAIIEECYRNRKDVGYPWQERSRANTVGLGTSRSRYNRILIVGASGFLGTNLAERLAIDLGANVRVGIHRPDTAARLARLPVEFAECDLLEPEQVLRSVEGCDAIINCARDRSGERTLELFVQGTRNLLQAAVSKGVKKYVHVSSAAVIGFKHAMQVVNESAPLVHSRDPYIRGKIKSEMLVTEYSDRIPAVILRPTLIYGPFSSDWVTQIVKRLRTDRVTLIGERKTANLVFVDDVVDAIICALNADKANGSTLVINNDENVVLWSDYIGRLSDLIGIRPVLIPDGHRFSFLLRQFTGMFVDSVRATNSTLRSSEMLALIARVPMAVILGAKMIKGDRRKSLESRLASPLEIPKPDPRVVLKYEGIDKGLWEVMTCTTLLSASKARERIGFVPRTSLEEGMRRSGDWMKWAGLTRGIENRQ
jgi:nucleoside-diphosphate-sugar epimerase